MKNILFLINHAGRAGTERYVFNLASNAGRFGYRAHFAYNESGALLEHMRGLGLETRRLPMRGPLDLSAAKKLAALCGELQIDVVQTNYLRENYIAILAKLLFKARVRVIYTNHFIIKNNLPVRLANRLLTRADHRIVSVCAAGAERLIINGNAKEKITVIHNAVDPDMWRPGPDYDAVRAGGRGRYGVNDRETLFFCASRFAHDKGHKFLIEALAKLAGARGRGDMRVLLAGDGPLEGEVRALAEERGLNGFVSFIGFVEDIKPLFYASDVYVNPSEHEASSFLILEALASGLPVIAADMGGNREIINESNGCGVLVGYGDTDALSGAIEAYLTGAADTKAQKAAALRTIKTQFSLEDMLSKTFAAFD